MFVLSGSSVWCYPQSKFREGGIAINIFFSVSGHHVIKLPKFYICQQYILPPHYVSLCVKFQSRDIFRGDVEIAPGLNCSYFGQSTWHMSPKYDIIPWKNLLLSQTFRIPGGNDLEKGWRPSGGLDQSIICPFSPGFPTTRLCAPDEAKVAMGDRKVFIGISRGDLKSNSSKYRLFRNNNGSLIFDPRSTWVWPMRGLIDGFSFF